MRCNGTKASARAIEASCNAKLSHTSKAMLRPPPTRALPQSRHSERGAFTRLSAKNLLATLASQTLIFFIMTGRGRRSFGYAQDDAKKKTFFARNEVAPTPEPSKPLAKHRSNAFFILTNPHPAVISTIRNYVYFFYINNDTGLKSITFLNIFKKILKIAKICSKLVVKF